LPLIGVVTDQRGEVVGDNTNHRQKDEFAFIVTTPLSTVKHLPLIGVVVKWLVTTPTTGNSNRHSK
jgi:hypothetical protein